MPPHTSVAWLTQPRLYAYGIISTLVALSTVAVAFAERSNFYAAVVFLGRSNGCLLVLLNFLLVIALLAGRCLQLLYFGQLRRSEVELVCERSWYSLVGTLLAVSIFRDDFSVSFVILFGVLLFLKIFHWLSAERVASIMQSPSVPRIFHARMVSILFTLFLADSVLVGFGVQMLIVKKIKVGMMVLFTSEFIILTALLFNTIAQYILNCIDMAREDPWEAKSLYVLYVDLAHDVVRLCTHGYFFVLLTRMYGIPLSLIHDLYSAGRACTTKVQALVRYRQAVKKMETKYPNASAADLQSTDGTCIICREDMIAVRTEQEDGAAGAAAPIVTNVTPKKLPCGHIFHFRCLRSWLERQQSCPTCRRMILEDDAETPTQAGGLPPQGRQEQQQQDAAAASNGEAAARAGGPPSSTSAATTTSNAGPSSSSAVEQQFESRLQGFLSRLQTDLRKVREAGDVSTRNASSSALRRRTSRSGHSTPRSGGDTLRSKSAAGLSGFQHQRSPRSHSYVSGTMLPAPEGEGVLGNEVDASSAGLWMPPPPSTLYPNGRRPTTGARSGNGASAEYATSVLWESGAAEEGAKGKGKGKARETTTAGEVAQEEEEAAECDPVDPRDAIRQATLKRLGHLAAPSPSSSIQTTSSSASSPPSPPPATATATAAAAAAAPALGLIPLFDPTQIADFSTTHLPTLPHPLLSPSASACTPLNNADPPHAQAILSAKHQAVTVQIQQLSAIQSRIDHIINDLSRVLDTLHPSS